MLTLVQRGGDHRPIGACVVDPHGPTRLEVAHTLRDVVPNITEYTNVNELPRLEPTELDQLLIVNYDSLDADQRAGLFQLLRSRPRNRCVLCSSRGSGPGLAELCELGGLTNIIARNDILDASEVLVTVQKLVEGRIFGIDKYFPQGTQASCMRLGDSDRRGEIIDAAQAFATQVGARRRLVNLFTTLADELVTNALYNAPTDRRGQRRFAHVSRTRRVTLEPHEWIDVCWMFDGSRLGISVADPFGSLGVDQVRSYMATYFRANKRTPRESTGGAGLGLLLAFGAVTQFVCNIRAGRRTEVIGTLDLAGSYQSFASRAKSFHVFVERARAQEANASDYG